VDSVQRYTAMRDALAASGRPIVYSISEWGTTQPWNWAPAVGNLWRTTGDISDSWSSMLSRMDANAQHASVAAPGAWNDPDMLEVGNGGMTDTEYRSHLSMWAVMAAPLLAGNDLTTMSSATRTTLTNSEILAVDQDPAGKQGTKVAEPTAGLQVWSKPVQNGVRVVALLNRNGASAAITAPWSAIGLGSGAATVRDLWAHADRGSFTGSFAATVPSHGVVVLRVVPTGTSYEAESSTSTLAGGARLQSCTACSGHQKVGFVGNNSGTLQFNGVQATAAGSRSIRIVYASGTQRSASLSVNGGAASAITFPSTGSYTTPGTVTVSVNLQAGGNTLRFFNSSGWAPDFDRLLL
jgi:hypothetical protein